jgi:hypothetical protein
LQILGDEDGDDERVDGENTGHDDGDEALHDQVRPEGSHACNANAGFRGAISRARAAKDHGRGNTAHANEGRELGAQL